MPSVHERPDPSSHAARARHPVLGCAWPRTWAIALVAAIAVVVPVPVQAAPAVAAPGLRLALQDALGRRAAGVLGVHVVLADAGGLRLVPLGPPLVTTTGAVRTGPLPELVDRVLPGLRASVINLAVTGMTDRGQGVHFAPVSLGGSRRVAAKGPRLVVRASRALRPGDRLRAAAAQARARSAIVPGPRYRPSWCNYQLVDVADAPTTVGEMHVIPNVTQTFTYARGGTTDSEISVAVNPAGGDGSFTVAGSAQLVVADVTEISRTRSEAYGRVLKSSFRYGRFHKPGTLYPLDCLFADDDVVMAIGWNGGWYEGADVSGRDGACAAGPTSTPYESGDVFIRSHNELRTWGAAATVFGVALKARSGASERVVVRYVFEGPPGTRFQLCGVNAMPTVARRVFVDDDWE